ncbi:MAG: hypothetical protein COS28_06930 [Nitrospirae bacterium CG02_land_8_20_14_3_00_44_33]|nr:MAG: hypothetical protein COS28_06930 [Nitrospirae bacterium CG02_land_8_20_14_3_00_44_33]PJA81520.1 MAG: hypothetical protein CO147_09565 [Nitrospirae bacterium CG_4_9_14_3_um_filter_44_28]
MGMTEIIKKIYKQSAFTLVPLAIISAVIFPLEWKRLPLSILIGGILALANLKGLAWGIGGLVGTGEQVSGKLVFFSLIRLFILFAILIILLWLKVINIAGIFVGITTVLIVLLKVGFKAAKEA